MTFNNAGYHVEQARDGQEAGKNSATVFPATSSSVTSKCPEWTAWTTIADAERSQTEPSAHCYADFKGADRHRQMAVQLGASGYITKPYLEEALLDAAQRMLKVRY